MLIKILLFYFILFLNKVNIILIFFLTGSIISQVDRHKLIRFDQINSQPI